jgi:hypothetical protein
MNDQNTRKIDNTAGKTTISLAIWTAAWLVSLSIASFGPKLLWDNNSTLSIFFILVNVAFGVQMMIVNKNHLANLDELQRKISLEAMAIALGVAIMGGLSFSLLDINNIIPFDAEISYLVAATGISYMIAILIGTKRYQ